MFSAHLCHALTIPRISLLGAPLDVKHLQKKLWPFKWKQ